MANRIRDKKTGRFISAAEQEAKDILSFIGDHWGNPQTKTKKSAPDHGDNLQIRVEKLTDTDGGGWGLVFQTKTGSPLTPTMDIQKFTAKFATKKEAQDELFFLQIYDAFVAWNRGR